jgi:hypothetical protein
MTEKYIYIYSFRTRTPRFSWAGVTTAGNTFLLASSNFILMHLSITLPVAVFFIWWCNVFSCLMTVPSAAANQESNPCPLPLLVSDICAVEITNVLYSGTSNANLPKIVRQIQREENNPLNGVRLKSSRSRQANCMYEYIRITRSLQHRTN